MVRTARRIVLGLTAGLLLTTACSPGEAGQAAAGAPLSSPPMSSAAGSGAATSTSAQPGKPVTAAVVEEQVLKPMQSESDSFWDEIFALAGYSGSVDAPMKFLDAGESFECGDLTLTADDTHGPAYCAVEDTIVVSETFMADLGKSEVLRGDGTFVDPADDVGVYFLLAHEWGHNVILELAEEEQLDLAAVPSVEIENLSDCLAGLMIAGVPRVFEDKDTDNVLAYAEALGEPFGGTVGTPQERRAAVSTGMAVPYEDRQQFVVGVTTCVTDDAPTISAQR